MESEFISTVNAFMMGKWGLHVGGALFFWAWLWNCGERSSKWSWSDAVMGFIILLLSWELIILAVVVGTLISDKEEEG